MNASWPMVIGALLAGTVGGFMIPVRPEIRDVPAISASKATEPAKKSAANKGPDEVRQISLTESAAKESEPATQATAKNTESDCSKEAWPHRSPNCVDRSAKVAPAETVVPARRIDPAVSVQDKPEPNVETKSVAAPAPAVISPKQEAVVTPKPEPVKPQQKTVSAPPPREEDTERRAQPEQAAIQPARETRKNRTERPAGTEQAPTRPDEPRAQTAAEQDNRAVERPRRSSRRVNRDDLDDGIPTKIYLRGPDGRLYLAPEYRPSGRTVYYMR